MLDPTEALTYALLVTVTALCVLTVAPTVVMLWLVIREERAARREEADKE